MVFESTFCVKDLVRKQTNKINEKKNKDRNMKGNATYMEHLKIKRKRGKKRTTNSKEKKEGKKKTNK